MSFDLTSVSWRKSTRSQTNGQCVEVGCAHDATHWRKSTRSSTNGQCVEVADVTTAIAVRDSKNASGTDYPVLTLDQSTWTGFLIDVRSGRLDG